MGIYCYTLRKRTIKVDGMEIGHTKYAYKDGWDARESAHASRLHAAAERARAANPTLTHIIIGDYTAARDEPINVMKVSENLTCFFDGKMPGPVVGHLVKKGRRYEYVPKQETVDA